VHYRKKQNRNSSSLPIEQVTNPQQSPHLQTKAS